MLANLLLAVALGQGCGQPATPNDPPPCAAMNVPGCLPGYVPIRDRYGRLIYACEGSYRARAQLVPAYPAAAPALVQPSYPPPYPAHPAAEARAPRRGLLALVLTPGRTTDFDRDRPGGHDLDKVAAAAAIELRGREGGARVRFQYQLTELGRVAELGLKYDFFDRSPLRPFVGLAAGGATTDPDRDWRASGSAFAGVDVYLSRNAFLTAEIQGRRFATRSSGGGRGLELTGQHQTTALAGLGIYL